MDQSHSAGEHARDVLGQHEFARIDLHHKTHQMNRRIANIPGNSLLTNLRPDSETEKNTGCAAIFSFCALRQMLVRLHW